MIIKKETSLENVNADVKETLVWKLEQLESNNLPTESGLADYIFFGMNNIDAKVDQLKNYKASIDKEIKSLNSYKLDVSEKIAEFIQEQGVDKLKGLECSSITINKGSEETEETKEYKEFKTDLTKEQIEKLIIDNGLGHYESKETIKVVPATKDKIKINKKRK